MYQEIILDHYKHPHHAGLREPFEAEGHHVNPTCGDEIRLRVHLAGDGVDAAIEGVSYDGVGCSRIRGVAYDGLGGSASRAAASVLPALLIGKPVKEALGVHDEFVELMQGR